MRLRAWYALPFYLSNQLTKMILFIAKQVFILDSSIDILNLLCDANTHPILYRM